MGQWYRKGKRMRARVGDLVIVRFDPSREDVSQGRKWDERVGLVLGCENHSRSPREYKFVWWENAGIRIDICKNSLPLSRLVRARPINDDWEGTLSSLTIDNVEPVKNLG